MTRGSCDRGGRDFPEELLLEEEDGGGLGGVIAALIAAATRASPTDSAKSRGVFPSVFLFMASGFGRSPIHCIGVHNPHGICSSS